MRKLRSIFAILTVLMLTASLAGARGGGVGTNECGDGEGGHTVTWTPTTVWPPNHKYQDVTITYTDSSEDHQLTLAATSATHDQYDAEGNELNGAGNTDEDVVLPADAATGTESVSVIVRARGERSGRDKTGRVYTVDYTANSVNADGETDNTCDGQITVTVPHDCRNGQCNITKQSGGSTSGSSRKAK